MHGFYDAVSIFVMETILKLQKAKVKRIQDDGFPRILNWSMGGKGRYSILVATVFKHVLLI